MKKLKLKKINLKKKSKDKGNKKPVTKNDVLSILLIAGIALISVALVFALYIIISSPDFDKEKLYSKESSVLYYNDGKTELARLGQYDRVLVNYDELPQVLIDAIVATEDSRFFQHNGLDMARVKGAMMTRKRRNKMLKLAKGYWGAKSKHFKMANEQVMKSLTYAYVGRRLKKRDFRQLWITRISAACKLNGMNYSTFMHGLKLAGVAINRKMLSEMAINDAVAFTALCDMAKAKLA